MFPGGISKKLQRNMEILEMCPSRKIKNRGHTGRLIFHIFKQHIRQRHRNKQALYFLLRVQMAHTYFTFPDRFVMLIYTYRPFLY